MKIDDNKGSHSSDELKPLCVGRSGHILDIYLEEYISGNVSELERLAIDEHVSKCESCRIDLHDMREIYAATREAATRQHSNMLPTSQSGEVQLRVRMAFNRPRWVTAVCAVVIVIAVITVVFRHNRQVAQHDQGHGVLPMPLHFGPERQALTRSERSILASTTEVASWPGGIAKIDERSSRVAGDGLTYISVSRPVGEAVGPKPGFAIETNRGPASRMYKITYWQQGLTPWERVQNARDLVAHMPAKPDDTARVVSTGNGVLISPKSPLPSGFYEFEVTANIPSSGTVQYSRVIRISVLSGRDASNPLAVVIANGRYDGRAVTASRLRILLARYRRDSQLDNAARVEAALGALGE